MSKIQVNAVDQNIAFVSTPKIYSGDVNIDYVHFEFDEVWTGFTKTAVFYREVENPYFQVLEEETDECVIPKEVLSEQGKFYMGVFGVDGDKVITSEVIVYEIGQGVMTPVEIVPTPDIWQQMLSELNDIRQEVSQSKEDFKNYYESLKSISLPTGAVMPYAGATAPSGYLLCQGQAVSRTTYAELFEVIGSTYGAGDGTTTFNLPNLKGNVPVGLNTDDTDFKTLGKISGEKKHTLTVNEMPSHNHEATVGVDENGAHTHTVSGTAQSSGTHTHSSYYLDDLTSDKGNSRRRGVADSNSGSSTDNIIAAGAHTHTVSATAQSSGTHTHDVTVEIANKGGGTGHNNLQPYIVLNYIIKY